MNVKLDKKKLHTNPKFTKLDLEAKVETDRIAINHRIDPSVGIETKVGIEEITTTETITGPIIGKDQGITIGMTIEEITTGLIIGKTVTDKTIEGKIEIDKFMEETTPNRGIEIEVGVGKVLEIIIVMIQETEVGIGIETDKCDQELECYLMKDETDQGLTLG